MDLLPNDVITTCPTLCLNMIVKNESKIITRLFDSIVNIIDCFCICDTGSTDNTVELIENYFKDKNIPGKVVLEPFKNFCHNRNFSLNSCVGMSDYVLLLDADMVLDIRNFDKNKLSDHDCFHILQGNDSFYYKNLRIVKNNGLFSYTGVTHEYINTPSDSTTGFLERDSLFIIDIGDGGSKTDKFERDVKLLSQGIIDEPNNERYHFYLANSYFDLGKSEEAIENYKKRINFGGWTEEVWYSYYKMGQSYMKIGQESNAICTWLEGYNLLPERLEGLFEIIKYYRINSKQRLSYEFYKLAIKILDLNLNRDNYLFLHNDVYTSKIYNEFTIIACYVGEFNINNEVIKVLNNSNDHHDMYCLLRNMKFYKDILTPIEIIDFDNSIVNKINKKQNILNSSSSCIIKKPDSDGYLMNIRYVNYLIDNNGKYLNCDKYILTQNKFVELDSNFEIIESKFFDVGDTTRRYIGIEDIRIFNDVETNQLLFIGTGFHKSNKIGIVSGVYDIDNNILEYNEIYSEFKKSDCEKNWVYVDYKNSTHIVYEWNPLTICKLDKETNLISVTAIKKMPNIFSKCRGSTSGFKYINNDKTEIWFINHLVSYEEPRCYYHLLCVFDEEMNLLRYSAPFKFEDEPIEYCLGLIVENNRIIMSFSNWDRTSRIGIYDKQYIDSKIIYIN